MRGRGDTLRIGKREGVFTAFFAFSGEGDDLALECGALLVEVAFNPEGNDFKLDGEGKGDGQGLGLGQGLGEREPPGLGINDFCPDPDPDPGDFFEDLVGVLPLAEMEGEREGEGKIPRRGIDKFVEIFETCVCVMTIGSGGVCIS